MLKWFGPKSQSMLGIDISSQSVKILELERNNDQYSVKGFGIEPVPEEAFEEGMIVNHQMVADAIRRVISREKLTSKQAAFAIPDSAVITRVIQLNEGLNEDEMEEIVILEADKYIPYSIDEINLDFQVIGPSAKNASMLDVLMVASRATNVDNRVEVAHLAGLTAMVIDVESYAVERVVAEVSQQLPAEGVDKVIAIVDIGAKNTHLFVLDGMKIIFSREEEFGGNQLIQSIMKVYKVNQYEAAQMCIHGKPDDFDKKVWQPFQESLMVQIKRTLQFFFSTSSHQYIDYILLAGGVSCSPGLDKAVEASVSVPTAHLNPFKNMNVDPPSKQADLELNAPALLVACGLALRKLDK
ncbi:type IV pilus assembly protein PilM [Legionella sp. W05-934-2]|uniref:type IV pilus assembly protein PilM n=1 Tax=Legionella sp. W05-934-2 TaxID=1198649 RepID=UPI0034632F16